MHDIILIVVSAISGCVATIIAAIITDKRKERKENNKESKLAQEKLLDTRPEFDVVEYKDYISRVAYGIKQKCDIDLFVARIENITIQGDKKHTIVIPHYREEDFNPSDWCCAIYTLENKGKTDISLLHIICNFKENTCIFPSSVAKKWADENDLNYSYCYDKKIRAGGKITVKFCYHKERIITGLFSAVISIGMEDYRGNCWTQPLFAPSDEINDSLLISRKDYLREIHSDSIVKNFIAK